MSIRSLESFPTEALVLVTQHLLSSDLDALVRTGSRTLYRKLIQGGIEIINVSSIPPAKLNGGQGTKQLPAPSFRLSSFFYELNNIRKLRISAAETLKVDHTLPIPRWSATLTHLEVVHPKSYCLLLKSEFAEEDRAKPAQAIPWDRDILFDGTSVRAAKEMKVNPWLPLEQFFPKLRTLIVEIPHNPYQPQGRTDEGILRMLFESLPSTLICFGTTFSPAITPELVALLPPSLTDWSVRTLLTPPAATGLGFFGGLRAPPRVPLAPLPRTLKYFSLGTLFEATDFSDSGLKSLRVENVTTLDIALPEHLEVLEIVYWNAEMRLGQVVRALQAIPQTLTSLQLPISRAPGLSLSLVASLSPTLTKLVCFCFEFSKSVSRDSVIQTLQNLPPALTELRLRSVPWPTLKVEPTTLTSVFSKAQCARFRNLEIPLPIMIGKETWLNDLPNIQHLHLASGTITEEALIRIPLRVLSFSCNVVVVEGRFLGFPPNSLQSSIMKQEGILSSVTSWINWRRNLQIQGHAPQNTDLLLDGTRESDINWSAAYTVNNSICNELLYCPSYVTEFQPPNVSLKIRPAELPRTLLSIPRTYHMSYSELSMLPPSLLSVGERLVLTLEDEQVVPVLELSTTFPQKYIHPLSFPKIPNLVVPVSVPNIAYDIVLSDAILQHFPRNVTSMSSLALTGAKVSASGILALPPAITKLDITSVDDLDLLEEVYTNLKQFKALTSATLPHHPTLPNAGFHLLKTNITQLIINPFSASDSSVIPGEAVGHLPASIIDLIICVPCWFTDEHIPLIPPAVDALIINTERISAEGLKRIPSHVQKLGLATTPPSKQFYLLFASARRRVGGSFPLTKVLK
jgi:hypothetical protein